MTYDGEYSVEKDVKLYDRLLKSKHMSPFEHIARAMESYEFDVYRKYGDGWIRSGVCDNFKGFVSLRHTLENE
jgi:hypothetical protein